MGAESKQVPPIRTPPAGGNAASVVVKKAAKPTPKKGSAARYPCIFSELFVRDQIDPRVNAEWRDRYGTKPKFGDLRQIWRKRHCAVLNPYTSLDCPYATEECGMAFLSAIQTVTLVERKSPVGYFFHVAKTTALERADNKPLARDSGSRDRTDLPAGDDEGSGMRSSTTRLVAIGDVLRSLDPRSRQGSTTDGSEGPK